MSTTLDKLSQAGYLNQEQVLRIQREVAKLKVAMKANPELCKTAQQSFIGRAGGMLRSALPGAVVSTGLMAAGMIGQELVQDAYYAIKGSVMKGKYYKEMLDAHPELKQYDSKTLQRHYDTLYKLSPEYASDPVLAGTHLLGTMSAGGFPLDAAHKITQIRKDQAQARGGIDFNRTMAMPMVHPGQLAAWQMQAQGADPAQIEHWKATAGKAQAEIQELRQRDAEEKARQAQIARAAERTQMAEVNDPHRFSTDPHARSEEHQHQYDLLNRGLAR